MQIISNEITAVVKYGRIKILTRVWELEYSYTLWQVDSPSFQFENTTGKYTDFFTLTNAELDEIDNLLTEHINK